VRFNAKSRREQENIFASELSSFVAPRNWCGVCCAIEHLQLSGLLRTARRKTGTTKQYECSHQLLLEQVVFKQSQPFHHGWNRSYINYKRVLDQINFLQAALEFSHLGVNISYRALRWIFGIHNLNKKAFQQQLDPRNGRGICTAPGKQLEIMSGLEKGERAVLEGKTLVHSKAKRILLKRLVRK
jgi:hypothetical protein